MFLLPLLLHSLLAASQASVVDDNSTIVVATKIAREKKLSTSTLPWRQVYTTERIREARYAIVARMLELLELSLGGERRILVRAFSTRGSCYPSALKCTNILASVAYGHSDLGLERGFLVGEAPWSAGVEFHWHVAAETVKLVTRHHDGLADVHLDIFFKREKVTLMVCATILVVALVIFAYISLCSNERSGRGLSILAKTSFWFFSTLSQQGDHDVTFHLVTNHRHAGRYILLLGITASMLCYNVYTAQMASEIAIKQKEPLSLSTIHNSMSEPQRVLLLTKEQTRMLERMKYRHRVKQKRADYNFLETSKVIKSYVTLKENFRYTSIELCFMLRYFRRSTMNTTRPRT